MRVLEVQMNCILAIIPVNKAQPIRLHLFEVRGEGGGKGGFGWGAELRASEKFVN